ncbi:protein DEFECTIVE IN MERISTEM SILENCING 3-like [Bidens hawaiensis]|uniref:protein DEFECTIVE IN MERISTEM SILENCING 3-like n=1 Tax=Bidens hawaiensis TaxID=980011 RepID=UPI00404ACA11
MICCCWETQHEENIKFLRTHTNVLDKQVTLGKYHSSTAPKIEDGDLSHMRSEEATIANVMKHEKTAAALFSQLKRHRNQAANIKDVLGVVATLGKLSDDSLSWLLSEYLGLDSMLSLVCITYDGIKALVTYDKSGSINKSSGLYGLGTAIGQPLEGRFNVFYLENLRPYVGDFMPNDPQKRLDLSKPDYQTVKHHQGFLGFAVNMIHIDDANLFYLTSDGNGLRETLFYTLFSRLQVYKTRAEMVQALPCIYDGAVSLDGGIIKGNGVYSLGTRDEIDVKFPITSGVSYLPEACIEVEKEMKELKWKRERMMEDIQREEALLAHVKYSFEVKKQEFLGFMAQSSPYTMPYPVPVQVTLKGKSTPR